jgi:hypothetical protein
MKTVIIVAGTLLVLAVNVMMYCCIRVGSREDTVLEKMKKAKKSGGEDDGRKVFR